MPGRLRGHPISAGFRRVFDTLRKVRRHRHLFRFLVAFILYNTGVGTIIVVAAGFGVEELGLGAGTLTGCILMIQLVGFPAALGFIALAKVLGTRGAILLGVTVYVGVAVFAFFMRTAADFWVMGFLVALVQGGTQALSRSLYGSMIPPGQSGEFFGFFSIFNKVGSFAGPLGFAMLRDATGSTRHAVLFIATFFILGFLLLLTVNVSEGQAAAQSTP